MPSSKDPVINRQKAKEYRLAHPEWKRRTGREWMRKKRGKMGKEWEHEKRFKKATEDPVGYLLRIAKLRASKLGLPFSITREDLVMPDVCPVFGSPWERVRGRMGWRNRTAPTVDRMKPALGYVPGNVWIISTRANRLKADATLQEIEAIASYMRRVGW